ncbi:MAG: hypothetical protein ACYDHW_12655 [Syntrophorhabdaceae bacterium]
MVRYLLMCVMVLGIALPVMGQDRPADNMQVVLEKARADKKFLVAQNMQFTESEAQAFWPVYEDYQNELFLVQSRLVRLITDYGAAYPNMNNDRAKALLDEYMKIEELRLKLRSAYVPKFRKVLPDVKVLRYYQIENKIGAGVNYEIAGAIPLVTSAEPSERRRVP